MTPLVNTIIEILDLRIDECNLLSNKIELPVRGMKIALYDGDVSLHGASIPMSWSEERAVVKAVKKFLRAKALRQAMLESLPKPS